MVIFVLPTATAVAIDGISPLMVQSAQLQQPLMVFSYCSKEQAGKKTLTVFDKLKKSVKKSERALCVWDSGSVNVLVMDLVTLTLAGTQCRGSTWKKYLLRRLKREDCDFFFVL